MIEETLPGEVVVAMRRRCSIVVLVDSHRKSLRALLRGIGDYGRHHGRWSLAHIEGPLSPRIIEELHRWRAEGLIYRCDSRALVGQIQQLHLPAISLREVFDGEEVLQIERHHQDVVRQAVDHLLERKFLHFAYCGFRGVRFSQRRQEALVAYLAAKGIEPALFTNLRPETWVSASGAPPQGEASLAHWLAGLEKPVGLAACNDLCGQQVVRACRDQGIAVPEEVAVVGVDNDDLLCDWCDPPLSSVDPNFERMGYEIAAALDRKMRGDPPPGQVPAVESLGVVLRGSSDVLAITDRAVALAMHYIRQHACEGIQVADVLGEVRLSRRTLERRFVKLLGRSPREEITRRQIERVQQLLAQTEFPLKKIAHLAGFNYPESMCHLFKQVTGLSPGAYRQQQANQGPARD